eukprot:4011636-Amphidinium_carterae.1
MGCNLKFQANSQPEPHHLKNLWKPDCSKCSAFVSAKVQKEQCDIVSKGLTGFLHGVSHNV